MEDTKRRKPNRVVSLLGASTEIIYRLGLGEKLVGRSHECDYPPQCLSLPCISRPRMDVESSSSLEIDEAVRNFSARDEPVYKLQDDTLFGLKPDLIIAQDHCRVCAVTKVDIEQNPACRNISQLILKPSTLNDCFDDVLKVADALGYPERGRRLYETLQLRIDRVRELGQSLLVDATNKHNSTDNDRLLSPPPRVALLEWCDPVMGCGYWLPELVSAAGGTPIFNAPVGGATPTISFSSLVKAKPDVVVLALCGFSVSRTIKEIRRTWTKEQINELHRGMDCRRNVGVYITDGNYLFNRSGPRVVESAEILLEAIHPTMRGHYGHFGTNFLMTLQDALDQRNDDTNILGSTIKIRPPHVEEKETRCDENEIATSSQIPATSASEMVSKQLECLRLENVHAAFSFNSIANQKRWCNEEQFMRALKSHTDFQKILYEIPVLEEDTSVPCNGVVNAKLSNGRTLVWTCVVENETEEGYVWRTERVGVQ